MGTPENEDFNQQYQTYRKCLKLSGRQLSTRTTYARAVWHIGKHFDYRIDNLSEAQLIDYFTERLDSRSWSTVKLELYGLKFYYTHVLGKPWTLDFIKPPRVQRLPDIVTVEEAKRLFLATRIPSYRVFFFTLYSLGLRLGEGLRLQVRDIDSGRYLVHIRDAKGNKDRFVPLPDTTLKLLRDFWRMHRNPTLLFPNRRGGVRVARTATTFLESAGIRAALRGVLTDCGLKKRSHPIACAIATQPT